MPAGGPGWALVVWLHSEPGPCLVILVTLPPQAGNMLASLTFGGTWESRAQPPCGRGRQLQGGHGGGRGYLSAWGWMCWIMTGWMSFRLRW